MFDRISQLCRGLLVAAVAVVALVAVAPGAARAAESYDNCSYTVTSLPTVISTQGVWCLKADVATLSTSGTMITIDASNVTLNCNGFKIGGLAGGAGSVAVGVSATDRSNVTIRDCIIRGFYQGVVLTGSAGTYTVEDNRFDYNMLVAIRVDGQGSIVRRNTVLFTGGASTDLGQVVGIRVGEFVKVVDNEVRDVTSKGIFSAIGIYSGNDGANHIARNTIGEVINTGSANEYGIYAGGDDVFIESNVIFGNDAGTGTGILCAAAAGGVRANAISGLTTGMSTCTNLGDNDVY